MSYTKATGLIILIFAFFCCCKNNRTQQNGNSNQSGITEQIIDTTANDKLLEKIYFDIENKLPKDNTDEYNTVMSWNKSKQAIYIIWQLESEVNNGGFDQFYINSSGKYRKDVPIALRRVGAIQYAELVERANKTYDILHSRKDSTTITEEDRFENLDATFFNLYKKEDLYQLQVNFIRKNRQDFVEDSKDLKP